MTRINLERIEDTTKRICKVISYVTLTTVSRKVLNYITNDYIKPTADYSDAVDAIMKSDMFSSSKREAVAAVKRYGDSEYYKTVIRIVRNVNTFPSTRVEMIKDLKC